MGPASARLRNASGNRLPVLVADAGEQHSLVHIGSDLGGEVTPVSPAPPRRTRVKFTGPALAAVGPRTVELVTTLVFFPGLHGDAQTWAPVIGALPDKLSATALDLPAVADLDALVDEVDEQIADGSVVVGHSLGGVVAMHLAERHPELLAGLVLVTAPVGAEDSESASARADRAASLSREEYEEIALDGVEAVYYGDRGHDPQVRAERLRAARVYGPERFAAHSVAIGSRPDRWDFPATAPCPVLIVGASDDQVVRTDEQRQWAEANGAGSSGAGAGAGPGTSGDEAGGVTYVEIPETGHMPPVEAPDKLAGAIGDWLRGLTG